MTELEALVALGHIPNVGPVKARQLMLHAGSARSALELTANEVGSLKGFGDKVAHNWETWKSKKTWLSDLDLAHKEGAKVIAFNGPEYPKALLEIPDYPLVLYIMGALREEDTQSVAVVGTRQADIYGMEKAESISKDLAGMGYTIISGLARGIDTAAHQGALKTGRTIAVLGSGLNNLYPRENKDLARQIALNGAVISEFPMATAPDKYTFPKRNRIVSGMSLGTLLIEAPIKSGAMITMDRAKSQGRQLFALPGRIDNPQFEGNHLLIKKGEARLIATGQDIAERFEEMFGFKRLKMENKVSKPKLTIEEEDLFNRLPPNEINIEELVALTKLPIRKINILLMSLLMKKLVKEFPGKVFLKAT